MAKSAYVLRRLAEIGLAAAEVKEEPAVEPVAVEAPAIPVFDPEALAVQTYSAEGSGFIQGKNFFTPTGKFVRALPKSQWYVTTPEMEANNRKARAKQRAMFMGKQLAAKSSSIPDKLVEALKENAQALSAEALAE